MADDNGRNDFSDFDVSELFTDFKTHSDNEDKNKNLNKQKFVVHIDDSDNDSFDYDFAAFSSPSARENERRRREESSKSYRQLDEELGLYRSANNAEPQVTEPQRPQRPRRPVAQPVQRQQRTAVPYTSPAQRRGEQQNQARQETAMNSRTPVEDMAQREAIYSQNPQQRPQVPPQQRQQMPPQQRQQVPPQQRQQMPPQAQPLPPQQSAQKQNNPQQAPQKKVVRLRTRSKRGILTGFAGFIAIVLAFTILLSSVGLSTIGDIVAYNRDETSITVVIENEKNGNSPTLDHVIDALHSAGLVKQKFFCKLFAKFRHYDGYTNKENVWVPTEYLSGIYYLEPGLGLEGMLNTIKKSTSTGEYTVTLTFPEGWSASQIFERLEKNGVCDASKLYANMDAVAKQYDFFYNINQSGVRYLSGEGYLFPDTYEFFKNENAVSVLRKLFDNADAKWKKSYDKRAKELGYTRDEILTIASIIQREAANASQMPDVSSVLHNRLSNSTYPSLQVDSSLNYVTNYVKGHVDANLAEVYTNAYNTYRVEGLPPGPICNPGIDAIEAALNPSQTNYYFFAHNNNGKIYLSENYAQFQKDCVQVAKDNAS